MRKVLPFLTREYFSDSNEKVVFDKIVHFINQYNALPDQDALIISVQNDKKIAEMQYAQVVDIIHQLEPTDNNLEWLIVESEKFCKDKALYNAILESISLIDEKNSTASKDGIPSILQAALSVCFDTNIGHDYIDNAESRYDFYHKLTTRIPFDLELLNKITNGGMPNKTLNIILAGTGAGKSLFMCHQAAACLTQGRNVLYITLEMAEERIAERIDANLMNITLDQLREIPREVFDSRIEKIRNKTEGRLIIKEYPTAGAHVGHFKGLLTELSMKRSFKPDIIIVDYLNICTSSRFKGGSNVNSYTIIKSIAEELRGLAVEMNVPILSATQTTRGGYGNTDVELTDTSESFGLPATADLMFALIASEELDAMNQIMVKQLKNRYGDPNSYKRFVLGIDRAKMKLYDLEPDAQKGLTDSGQPLPEKPIAKEHNSQLDFGRKPAADFSGIKF
jgi:replicative DNA helicase